MALDHPNWSMGPKITIDSATLMNKGLEVIEAHWLFGRGYDDIKVVVHPQSVVHSLVEYVDGSFIAQLGQPDMKTPIAFALSHPQRLALDLPRLDLAQVASLDLRGAGPGALPGPGPGLCRRTREGGSAPAVMNAANEVAVGLFLQGTWPITKSAACVRAVLDTHQAHPLTQAWPRCWRPTAGPGPRPAPGPNPMEEPRDPG